MRTKINDSKISPFLSGKSRFRKGWEIFSITIVILNILSIAYLFSKLPADVPVMTAALQKMDRFLPISEMADYPMAIRYHLESILTPQDAISIEMNHINVQKIEYMRQRAMQSEKDFKYVPAVIRHGKESVKVKIRLKGDRKIHFDDIDTASFRIRVKGDHTLFGMNRFQFKRRAHVITFTSGSICA